MPNRVQVSGGLFKSVAFTPISGNSMKKGHRDVGAKMMLDFVPDDELDADNVSLLQIVKRTIEETGADEQVEQDTSAFEHRRVTGGTGAGFAIDQEIYDANGTVVNLDPRYSQTRLVETAALFIKPPAFPPPAPNTGYSASKDEAWTNAQLKDAPAVTYDEKNTVTGGMQFEVAALAEKGDARWYVGSVSWSWEIGDDGEPVLSDIVLADADGASDTFFAAVARWNEARYPSPRGQQDEKVAPFQIPGNDG